MRHSASARAATLCLVVLAVLLAGCQTTTPSKSRPRVEIAPAPYFDSKTGIYFPGALGKLFRKPIVRLEEKTPGLGLAITYISSDARIDVFVFDLQASIIPTGTDPLVVQQSFQTSIEDLQKAASKKLYRNLQIGPESDSKLSGLPFLQASFSYDEAILPKEGQIWVAGINGQILKIRAAKTRGSPTDIGRLLGYIGQAIKRSQQNGYNGIDEASFRSISQSLEAIDLSNGLSPAEAIAIAQIELVNNGRHNRFDASTATISTDNLPQSATVTIAPYPSQAAQTPLAPIQIRVLRNGDATLLSTDS